MAEQHLAGVITVEPESPEFGDVLALWRMNRATLGFLPDQGFVDRAERGRLLAYQEAGELTGYVLFDLPGTKIKLVHLCVSKQVRGKGTARALVDELSRLHPERRGIELACRRDYFEANRAWQALGFVPLHEKPGRSNARLPLTLWVREHGHPNLFDISTGRDVAVLDHSVIVDKATGFAGEASNTRFLFDAAWVEELVELVVTSEAFNEINRQQDASVRETTRAEAQSFRMVQATESESGSRLPLIRELAPKAGDSDHLHLTHAIASAAEYFVTRDDEILDAASRVESSFGIKVLRPEQLVSELDRRRSGDRYEPRSLQGTSVTLRPAADFSEAQLVYAFLNFADGERKAPFLDAVRALVGNPEGGEAVVVSDAEGRLLGLVGRSVTADELRVRLLRVGGPPQLRDVVARQLLYLQRKVAAERALQRVRVTDALQTSPIELALDSEGFRNEGNGWSCAVRCGMEDARDLSELQEGGTELAQHAANLEDSNWPLKVLSAGIRTFLVPIRLGWAVRLFDNELAEQTLLPRGSELGLSREHVYYRSPRNHRGLGRGDRILWYVTGVGPLQNEAHVRAVSRVAEVVIAQPRSLYRRFSGLGVYDLRDVEKLRGKEDAVMAIRFTNTEVFGSALSRTVLEQTWNERGSSFQPPLCPTQIGERMFCPIYREGSRYV